MNKIEIDGLHFIKYIDQKEIGQIVRRLAADIKREYVGSRPIVLIILKGSIHFASQLLLEAQLDSELVFIKINSYNGLDTSGKINIELDIAQNIENRDILIIEDIVDTGTTLHQYEMTLRDRKPKSIKICTLLMKPSKLQYSIDVAFCGLEIEDKFVIGYGLDYNEHGRNLADIYQLKQE